MGANVKSLSEVVDFSHKLKNMNKFIRSLTVIGAASALTFAGTSAATAQTSMPDLDRLSSWVPGGPGQDNTSQAERQLHSSAEGWAKRSTTRNSSNNTLNDRARTANLNGTWVYSGVTHIYTQHREWDNNTYRNYRVPKEHYRALVNNFNDSGALGGKQNHHYGLNVRSDANHYYVTVVFRHNV